MTEEREIPADEPVRTGVESVDAVLATVEELEDRPVEEHVGVFEAAHEGLRRALDSQPTPTPTMTSTGPGRPGPR